MKHCKYCGCETWEPGDPYDGPGVPITLGGQRHKSSCPTVPHLSREAEAKLRADLDEMDRMRRRAEVESRHIVIY